MLAEVLAKPTSRWHEDTRYTVVMFVLETAFGGAAREQQPINAITIKEHSFFHAGTIFTLGAQWFFSWARAYTVHAYIIYSAYRMQAAPRRSWKKAGLIDPE